VVNEPRKGTWEWSPADTRRGNADFPPIDAYRIEIRRPARKGPVLKRTVQFSLNDFGGFAERAEGGATVTPLVSEHKSARIDIRLACSQLAPSLRECGIGGNSLNAIALEVAVHENDSCHSDRHGDFTRRIERDCCGSRGGELAQFLGPAHTR